MHNFVALIYVSGKQSIKNPNNGTGKRDEKNSIPLTNEINTEINVIMEKDRFILWMDFIY